MITPTAEGLCPASPAMGPFEYGRTYTLSFIKTDGCGTCRGALRHYVPPEDRPWDYNEVTYMVSREMALDYGVVVPTPVEAEVRARRSAWFREADVRHKAAVEQWEERWRDNLILTAATLPLALAELHERSEWDKSYCRECSGGDNDVSWPCDTIMVVAVHEGLPFPEYPTIPKEF